MKRASRCLYLSPMNNRLINIGLVLAFFICYMEWGGGNSSFVFQSEYQIFTQSASWRDNFAHPIILAGLLGQLLFLYAAFKKTPSVKLTWAGILILSPVVLLIFLAGALSMNWKMVLSVLPFLALAVMFWRNNRKQKAGRA